MKIFEYVFIILGIFFLGFVAFGLRTEQGYGAVKNFCAPVNWLGNVSVSTSAVIDKHTEADTQKAFQHMHYSCEYIGWRLFFESKYKAYEKKRREEERAGVVPQTPKTARYRTQARYPGTESVNPVQDGIGIVNQGAPGSGG